MAVLSEAQRDEIWQDMMRQITCGCFDGGLTKAQLRQAVADADDWLSTNQSTVQTLYSAEVEASMTADARQRLFAKVAMFRGNNGVT